MRRGEEPLLYLTEVQATIFRTGLQHGEAEQLGQRMAESQLIALSKPVLQGGVAVCCVYGALLSFRLFLPKPCDLDFRSTAGLVVLDTGGSGYQSPCGSCSHSTTWHVYEPLSELRARRMLSSKLGPSLRCVLIRCLWLGSTCGANVTRASWSELTRVRFSACCCSRQVTE
ncbi:hypothetical protein EYF80_050111 [Liparis tanakae]|uniref:Uncharacterized protein n=1 Tax=Liparis tanakae TaxID=230148 RepID=A0A4Z2FFN0_9TELE|nr:hypothetical protein EYF80_050111 [Liparis tanakae]